MSDATSCAARSRSRTARATISPTRSSAEVFAPDVVLDMSARVFNPQVYEGYDGLRQFRADAREVWETLSSASRS